MGDKIKVIMDCDPGIDDGIALAYAAAHQDELELLAVTTFAGNNTIDKVTKNALELVDFYGLNVPVARGQERPLVKEVLHAEEFHGETGLGHCVLPEAKSETASDNAVLFIRELLNRLPEGEQVIMIETAPMTNLALLLKVFPEIKNKIGKIVFMGGAAKGGNITPAAEFNIYADPEAAKIVFESGIPILMAGLDVTEKALIMPEDFERIRALGNPVSDIVAQWLEFFYKFHKSIGYEGAPMHDPCAVMALISPEVFTIKPMHVEIETQGEYCRGCTVGDQLGLSGKAPNAQVLLDVDRKAFADRLVESMKFYGEGVK